MRISEAAAALGCHVATVYRRINKYGWRQEVDDENVSWVWVPENKIKQRFSDLVAHETQQQSGVSQVAQQSQYKASQIYADLKQVFDDRLADKDQVIAALKRENETLRTHTETLNSDIAARNNQIQKYKSQEEYFLQLSERLDLALSEKRRWWKFW